MPRNRPQYVPLIPRPRDLSPDALAAELVVTVREAAANLRVSRRKVEYLLADGTIPSVKVGSRRLVLRAGLKAYVAGLTRDQRGV